MVTWLCVLGEENKRNYIIFKFEAISFVLVKKHQNGLLKTVVNNGDDAYM